MEDVLSHVSGFLQTPDLFKISCVNKEWRRGFSFEKTKRLTELLTETKRAHVLGNICPCRLEAYYKSVIENFNLNRYLCAYDHGAETPKFLDLYLKGNKLSPTKIEKGT